MSSAPLIPVIRPSAKFGSTAPAPTSVDVSARATSGASEPSAVAPTTVVAVPSTALVRNLLRSTDITHLLAVHGHRDEPAGQVADGAERRRGEVEDAVGRAAAAAAGALAAP